MSSRHSSQIPVFFCRPHIACHGNTDRNTESRPAAHALIPDVHEPVFPV
jgi:hypothetical protein